jgi:Flp pilus assembly protein TadG
MRAARMSAARMSVARAKTARGRAVRGDRGSVTAEFAVALPAVVLVLGLALAAMQLVGEQLRLQSAVADAARVLGRGEAGALGALQRVAPGATLVTTHPDGLVCARARAPAALGVIVGIELTASACALDDE